ncbi:MAG TPA: carbon starvation CstA family protein [Planctomycetota bacterium]|nr:carbon starvation CstA family protein [Planctomycetota bacterium]HRR81578.1 carbon starvation CstA family protein [Planctomycetota bacterium]HRT94869.1 carbon starvation CstA family protein [Planctomycetota bacterium]
MSLLVLAALCAAVLLGGYVLYGPMLSRLLGLDPHAKTPAVELRDDADYVPISPRFLIGQHFSAIAAAGPIVGPILAGLMFGWVPALLWIVLGSIFIGGVHDMAALVASVRHRARSIAEVVKEHMTQRAYLLFLGFVWLALVYVIVAFTDITASSFVGVQELESGERVSGGGIATSSLLYLALPVVMGVLLRYAGLSLRWATIIFLPLVGVAIWAGQHIPLDLAALLGLSGNQAVKVWDVLLLAYCFVASVAPMWILLQPRGHLGGYFLFASLAAALLGVVFGGNVAQFPAFRGWTAPGGDALFPILFITIACGACSGFHAIVASGTTSKQLRYETDAKPIGYGAMLLEGMVAVVSLLCLMMLAPGDAALKSPKPNFIYALGIGKFLGVVGIDPVLGISFGLMAFTTFVYDTLDVCTRLGRYIVQELLGWQSRGGRWFATALTAAVPLAFVMRTTLDAKGAVIPAWKVFWGLFGASNQLLAALTLIGVTVWLWRTGRARWGCLITGLPAVWMYVMSVWALVLAIAGSFGAKGVTADPVPWVALVLIGLAGLMLVEAVRVFIRPLSRPPAPATA